MCLVHWTRCPGERPDVLGLMGHAATPTVKRCEEATQWHLQPLPLSIPALETTLEGFATSSERIDIVREHLYRWNPLSTRRRGAMVAVMNRRPSGAHSSVTPFSTLHARGVIFIRSNSVSMPGLRRTVT